MQSRVMSMHNTWNKRAKISPERFSSRAQQMSAHLARPSVLGAEYGNNLRYFLKHGVAAGDGVTYLIIVQKARLPFAWCAAST